MILLLLLTLTSACEINVNTTRIVIGTCISTYRTSTCFSDETKLPIGKCLVKFDCRSPLSCVLHYNWKKCYRLVPYVETIRGECINNNCVRNRTVYGECDLCQIRFPPAELTVGDCEAAMCKYKGHRFPSECRDGKCVITILPALTVNGYCESLSSTKVACMTRDYVDTYTTDCNHLLNRTMD